MDVLDKKSKKANGIGHLGYLVAIVFALILLLLLQWQYWRGDYGYASLQELKGKLQEQELLNEKQSYDNEILMADVLDLKSGAFAIEEHARLDLGLIKSGEIFIQLSNAPITYSSQVLQDAEDIPEYVDGVPETANQ